MKLFDIEVPDLLEDLSPADLGGIESRDDIFRAFGIISLVCNEWEKKYKELVKRKNKNIDEKASLAHTHRKMKDELDKKVFDSIANVIEVRSYLQHEFLPSVFPCNQTDVLTFKCKEILYDEIKEKLNLCYNLFFEAIDYVDNLIDALDVSGKYYAKRRTVFD